MRSCFAGSNNVIQCRYHFATSLFATIISPLSFLRIDSNDEIGQLSIWTCYIRNKLKRYLHSRLARLVLLRTIRIISRRPDLVTRLLCIRTNMRAARIFINIQLGGIVASRSIPRCKGRSCSGKWSCNRSAVARAFWCRGIHMLRGIRRSWMSSR